MAQVTITIPDALVPRLTAMARFNFTQYAALTDAALFKRVTADYWSTLLVIYESNLVRTDASAQISAQEQQTRTDVSGIG